MQLKRYDVLRVAEHFLYLDTSESRASELITAMKLQKLLYYAQGYSLALHGEPLFDEVIQAWPHGPVAPMVYRAYSTYGRQYIPPPSNYDPDILDNETLTLLGMVQEKYGPYGAWDLRQMTHKERPYTATAKNAIITTDLMHEYFSQELRPAARRGRLGEPVVVKETLDDEETMQTGEFTALEREQMINGAIATEALEGYTLPREIAERAFESALRKPLPNIG